MEATVLAEEPVIDLTMLEHTDAPLRTHISHGRGRGRGGTPQNLIIYGAIDAERSDATNTHEIIPALDDSDDMNPRSVTAPPEAKRSRISALGVAASAPPNGGPTSRCADFSAGASAAATTRSKTTAGAAWTSGRRTTRRRTKREVANS